MWKFPYVDQEGAGGNQRFYLAPSPADRVDPGKEVKEVVAPESNLEEPQYGVKVTLGRFTLSPDASPVSDVGMTVRYEDPSGKLWSQKLCYKLKAKEPDEEPSEKPTQPDVTTPEGKTLELSFEASASSKLYRANERRDLEFKLKNTGDMPLEVYKIEFLNDNPVWPFASPDSSRVTTTDIKLAPGQTQALTLWEVQVLEDIAEGKYPLALKIHYRGDDGTEAVLNQPYEISVIDMEAEIRRRSRANLESQLNLVNPRAD